MARKNFAVGSILTAPSPATSGTSVVLNSGHGTRMYVGKAFYVPANFNPLTDTAEEITISVISTDTLTIVRNTDSRGAATMVAGGIIRQGLTATETDSFLTSGATDEGYNIYLPMASKTGGTVPLEVSDQSSGATVDVNNWQVRAIQTGPSSSQYGAWISRIGSTYTGDKVFPAKGGVMIGLAGGSGDGVITYLFISTSSTPGSMTADCIGLQMDKVSGTVTASSSTGDGTTQQKVSLSGITYNMVSNTSIRNTWTYDGVTVKFYCDGVLKNSHSTNVPRITASQVYSFLNVYKGIITSTNIYTALVNYYQLTIGITH